MGPAWASTVVVVISEFGRTFREDRDWPVLTEYRGMLAGLFTRMYGPDPTRLGQVFPRTSALDLGVL